MTTVKQVVDFLRRVNPSNAENMILEMWTANENNVRGYVCKDRQGKVLGTKFFMDDVKPVQVAAAFNKDLRNRGIILR